MAGMCCGVNMAETEAATTATYMEKDSEIVTRRRMEIHQFRLVANEIEKGRKKRHNHQIDRESNNNNNTKRLKLDTTVTISLSSPSPIDNNKVVEEKSIEGKKLAEKETEVESMMNLSESGSTVKIENEVVNSDFPKFGSTSVCGRRRDMEDAVAIHPMLCKEKDENSNNLHFFGVFDGHGCSHVAMRCKDRMHEIVRNEVEENIETAPWKDMMVRSFSQMDKEAGVYSTGGGAGGAGASNSTCCRCELQTPQCDAVGSTAVVALVTPDKIIVSNCGDSRAVLCRNGVAIPLSIDHKPDRPDELNRIQEAGGRVIYWDGPRVLGVLAMSRAIGDNYLKPYVISEPEVTVTERTGEDECLILASDGLWDVVSNETACGVARGCLQSRRPPSPAGSPEDVTVTGAGESSDKACSDASILLTKLALARRSTDNVSVVVVDLRKDL